MKKEPRGIYGILGSLRQAERLFCASERRNLPLAAQWVRDNARMLYGLACGLRGRERILKRQEFAALRALCADLCDHCAGPWQEAALCRAVRAGQGEKPLTVRALRLLPDALLREQLGRLCALLAEAEAQCRAWQEGARLAAAPASARLPRSPLAAEHALALLSEAGDTEGMRALEGRLRRKEDDPRALTARARSALQRTAEEMGALISALLSVPRLSGGRITERCSAACAALRKHPGFLRMDRESRALYLTAVSRLSRRLGAEETRVCQAALSLCRDRTGAWGDPGYFLLENSAELCRLLGKRPPRLSADGRVRLYAALLALGAALSAGAGFLLLPWYGAAPFAFAGMAGVHALIERAAARVLPRRQLPRLAPEHLPEGARALVAVPAVVTGRRQALALCRHLSVLYFANEKAPADFLLLCDFAESGSESEPEDAAVMEAALAGVEALRQAHGPRFFYLQRGRSRDAANGCWYGRERKRGALALLNALLAGETPDDPILRCTVDPARFAGAYTHVITLDADTFLPAGAAEKLLGTMLHPLQRDRVQVIQPRMLTLPMHVQTHAQAMLGGCSGADGYGASAAGLYQDAFGRGSFMGKGIYEPGAFRAATEALPAGRILSHDLIEGELARSAQANDIVCYDGHPRRVSGFLKRTHRWTRGDWQLLPFLLGGRLDLLSRLKIWDNLRRSLTPLTRMAALTVSALHGAWIPFLLMLFPVSPGELLLLPADALTRLDAIFRALWRMRVSHRKLLEWTTAAQAEEEDARALGRWALPMLCGAGLLFAAAASAFWPGFALGLCWLMSPLIARWMDRPRAAGETLTAEQARFLREIARDTLGFFDAHVTEQTHFLPPDNVQLSPPRGAALRTSPTNIGLYLLSLCAARELSLLSGEEMLRRMARAADAMEQLPCWAGIPYNWYDLTTLQPLLPRTVSSVDAGNYLICLTAAAQAARTRLEETEDAALRKVPARLDALCSCMELRRLYDRKARLFRVSLEGDTGALSASHYDLLASEAQLLSFAAIAGGWVEENHWWRLGRSWTGTAGRALLSWSGTMFEYMMGPLLLPVYEDSLLQAAQQGCVRAQRRAGRRGMFGISESGYARFDPALNYRYRAFGVADLALDTSSAGQVYAPYAAALALRTAPRAACRSLQRMREMGAYGEHGFYEAIDCTQGAPRIVRSHMAHHQGMLLCALCNALCADYLPRLLLQLPRVQAHLPLLNELPPRRVPRLPSPLRAHRDQTPEPPCRVRAAEGLPAEAHVLSGGDTLLLISSRGHSALRSGEIALTRFDPRQGALSGPQLWLAEEGQPPLRLTAGEYTWLDGVARCRVAGQELRSEVTACVDPLTGAAVYRLCLRSTASGPRSAALVFYLEPALDAQRADSAHTAFSNLFIRAEEAGENACLLRRFTRDGQMERTLTLRAWSRNEPMAWEKINDRAALLGREGTLDAPRGLWAAEGRLTDTVDVCAALRARFTLQPGQEQVFCFAVGVRVPEGLEEALRAENLAGTRSLVIRRMLGIDPARLALACRLAGRLLYAGDAALPARMEELWALGISGDLPLLLVTAEAGEDPAGIGQAALLLSWLREMGAEAELVISLPEEDGYDAPLRSFCEGLPLRPEMGLLHGHFHLLTGLSPERLRPLTALCAVHLRAGEPLADQLALFPETAMLVPAAPGGRLPVLPRLAAYNGYGGFQPDFSYAVCGTAPAPWCQILSNEVFSTLVCEQGILYSCAGNSRLRRVTRPCQDSVLTEPSEEYFIIENGHAWSLTRRPLLNADCRAFYDMGTAVYQCALPGLQAELTCFADAEFPCGGRSLLLRSTGASPRAMTVLGAARFALGEEGRGTACRAEKGIVWAEGGLPGAAFFYLDRGQASTAAESVYGIGGTVRFPFARQPGNVGILQREITLRPGESAVLCFWLGYCDSRVDAGALPARLGPGRERLARGAWQRRLDGLRFYLPDGLLAGYLNTFLPYQIRASRLQFRAGFYQSGGAWGFRDQLQDMLSLLYTEPERVRAHLLLCASRQYEQGDVQHWWHPGGAGVRTRISDDRLFLPWVTARYVHVTGDADILKEAVPWLRSPVLSEGERDRYEQPEVTREEAPLLEHCLRAIDCVDWGPRGIPRMGAGDWNDGMDRVGGESAWLGFFYLMVCRDFAPLCPPAVQDDLDRRRIRLQTALQAAWTGRWFLRAWYADGRTLGAPDSEVPRIDLISQCFACFAGMPRDQVKTALNAAWQTLYRPEQGIALLLTPPFTPAEKAGYIGAYRPGVRENGGQYTHAVPWFMRALLEVGQTERAWELLRACLPYMHSDTPEKARRYRTEPYALAADIHLTGRGGWTWYTGSAGWLYEVFLHDFMGFDKRGNGVRLQPRIPADWEECTVVYRFGKSRWQLTAGRDVPYITVDGEKAVGAFVTLRDDGRAHTARFPVRGWGDE